MANLSTNTTVRRTRPNFQLTNCVNVTRKRYTQVYVKGRPVTTVVSPDATLVANVQPMKFNELMLLPESDRTKEWIVLYLTPDQDIRTAKEGSDGYPADEVVWQSQSFKVMKIQKWGMGVLEHIKVLAAREPISAGY